MMQPGLFCILYYAVAFLGGITVGVLTLLLIIGDHIPPYYSYKQKERAEDEVQHSWRSLP